MIIKSVYLPLHNEDIQIAFRGGIKILHVGCTGAYPKLHFGCAKDGDIKKITIRAVTEIRHEDVEIGDTWRHIGTVILPSPSGRPIYYFVNSTDVKWIVPAWHLLDVTRPPEWKDIAIGGK